MKQLGIELALGLEFETNDLRSKDLSYIADERSGPASSTKILIETRNY